MKKQAQLLRTLALSIGMSLAAVPAAVMTLPPQIQGQLLLSLAPMLEKVLPAVVSIHVEGTETASQVQDISEPLKRFFGQVPSGDQAQPFEGLGSGVIIDAAKGYILTNNHVVTGADKIRVQLGDGSEYDAKLIGYDEQTDIALIQVEGAKNLTQVKVADSDRLKVGDFAVAIGNPYGLGQAATSGIISALSRRGLNLEGLENFIQTDAAINRGNSGGALVNLNGELIGINTAILAASGGNIGIGFAIPSDMAMNLALQLIKYGEVKHSHLGIKGTEMTADIAKAFNVDTQRGTFVSEVLPQSAAQKAGVKSGDIIISINDKPVTSFAELRAKVGTTAPGKKVELGLLRDGKPLLVKVKLEQSTTSTQLMSPALQGAKLSDGATKSGDKGVKIDSIDKGTVAEQIGLQKDDVIVSINSTHVTSLAEMRKVLEGKPPVMALNVVRGGESIYLLLR